MKDLIRKMTVGATLEFFEEVVNIGTEEEPVLVLVKEPSQHVRERKIFDKARKIDPKTGRRTSEEFEGARLIALQIIHTCFDHVTGEQLFTTHDIDTLVGAPASAPWYSALRDASSRVLRAKTKAEEEAESQDTWDKGRTLELLAGIADHLEEAAHDDAAQLVRVQADAIRGSQEGNG